MRRDRDGLRLSPTDVAVHLACRHLTQLEEMYEDDLGESDVRNVLRRGRVIARLARDPRGVRLVVRGTAARSKASVEVVCRFLPSGLLRIITVYRLESRHA